MFSTATLVKVKLSSFGSFTVREKGLRVGAIPVVSPNTSDLVGIVSYIDVLRAARDEL